MVIMTGSPVDLVNRGGRERRLHSSMYEGVPILFVKTGIVWYILCNNHDALLCYVQFTNEYHYTVWVFVSRRERELL